MAQIEEEDERVEEKKLFDNVSANWALASTFMLFRWDILFLCIYRERDNISMAWIWNMDVVCMCNVYYRKANQGR